MEIVASSIFILVLVLILIQCNLCGDSRALLDKPVDVSEGKLDGVAGAVETATDQLDRATNLVA